jgi:hypothetical protein
MKSTLFLSIYIAVFVLIYTPIFAQESSVKNVSSDKLLKHHAVFFSQDFYTFDDIGITGLFPTGLCFGYQYAWKKKRDYLVEFSTSTFGTGYHPLGNLLNFKHPYSNNKPVIGKYMYESRFFYTFSGTFKTSIFFKPLFLGGGVHYITGVNGFQSIEPSIGYIFKQQEANSIALSLSASYRQIVGEFWVIEPHIRYEYLLNDNEPHYLIGIKGGYIF